VRTAPTRWRRSPTATGQPFTVAIAVAALGMVAASLLLGRRPEPAAVAQAEPALA
jgi:hypothetical protein